jgi:SAM-dependent methyltransferase
MASHTVGSATPEVVFDMLFAYQRTAALRAAIEIDLFRAIGEGPGDVESIARGCHASERGVRILCDFLAVHGVLNKAGGRYTHTPMSALFLDPQSPACMASTARFLGNPMVIEPFNRLTEIVRTGHTVLPGQGSVEPNNPAWVEFARNMAPMMGPMARPLAAIALDGLRDPLTVLDIAAGHGLFGIEVLKQRSDARAVAVDWPAVLEVARENARKAGVDQRYETRPGSAFDVDFGGPYDVVLLTNFLHHFDPPTCLTLLKKVRAALRTGGRVATLEFVPNEDRVTPPIAAGFSLTMLATTPSGDAYTFSDFESMYREAGFANASVHPLPTGPNTVVLGHAV